MDNRPIGIFDSGIGGLTVFNAVKKTLPKEDIVYLGDTARLPYGSKSRSTIIRFSIENVLFLLSHNVKLIVVACNSSSSVSLDFLAKNFKVPIIGVITPGAKKAANSSRTKRIGIIGTPLTIKSNAYQREIKKHCHNAKILHQDCPLLVPLIENGWLNDI